MSKQPNILFVFADQWRASATGYAGNPQVRTPNLDRFAAENFNFTTAVSNCPVCTPYRATLMTGQYPLTHGAFVNDVPITSDAKCLGECFQEAGYDTGYIGKWHIDGHGRDAYIPPERRKGFQYWKVRECTHDYNNSFYYGDSPEKNWWDGYDAIAQTKDAQNYINDHTDSGDPFFLMLSWGPPHEPYDTAPQEFRELYNKDDIILRENVPEEKTDQAREQIAGYYAHCTALDRCFGELISTVDEAGIAEDTIVVFTSDHGDMLGSQGERGKQRPWDESILVPMLMRYPSGLGRGSRQVDVPFNSPHIMPTLLGLAGLEIPETVEGYDFAPFLRGERPAPETGALIELPVPIAEFSDSPEWRGLRTERYTYAITRAGPWVLYDSHSDPYQLNNLIDNPEYDEVREELDAELRYRLKARGDEFKDGLTLIKEAGLPMKEVNGMIQFH
jgi:arylsulfatase A-like enzyme